MRGQPAQPAHTCPAPCPGPVPGPPPRQDRSSLYLHRIQAHRPRLPRDLASSLEEKQKNPNHRLPHPPPTCSHYPGTPPTGGLCSLLARPTPSAARLGTGDLQPGLGMLWSLNNGDQVAPTPLPGASLGFFSNWGPPGLPLGLPNPRHQPSCWESAVSAGIRNSGGVGCLPGGAEAALRGWACAAASSHLLPQSLCLGWSPFPTAQSCPGCPQSSQGAAPWGGNALGLQVIGQLTLPGHVPMCHTVLNPPNGMGVTPSGFTDEQVEARRCSSLTSQSWKWQTRMPTATFQVIPWPPAVRGAASPSAGGPAQDPPPHPLAIFSFTSEITKKKKNNVSRWLIPRGSQQDLVDT